MTRWKRHDRDFVWCIYIYIYLLDGNVMDGNVMVVTSYDHGFIHCNTLQHTATHCNTLQYTATHHNILHYTKRHDRDFMWSWIYTHHHVYTAHLCICMIMYTHHHVYTAHPCIQDTSMSIHDYAYNARSVLPGYVERRIDRKIDKERDRWLYMKMSRWRSHDLNYVYNTHSVYCRQVSRWTDGKNDRQVEGTNERET